MSNEFRISSDDLLLRIKGKVLFEFEITDSSRQSEVTCLSVTSLMTWRSPLTVDSAELYETSSRCDTGSFL